MTDDELMTACHPSRIIEGLLQQATGTHAKEGKEELHRYIWRVLEDGLALDDRLLEYIKTNGLPAMGKPKDILTRNLGIALAVAQAIKNGSPVKVVLIDIARHACLNADSVEKTYYADKAIADEMLNDPNAARLVAALAEPYIVTH